MPETFDFVVVGGGSAGAALAARLTEDPQVTVALIEAGGKPPAHEAMPMACASLQLDPETDWMFRGSAGKGAQGFLNKTVPVPRGRMLGGSSGINYMVYVKGHPGDFDNWAARGATGWSFADVRHCFERMEEVRPSNEAIIDSEGRGTSGPIGVGIRSPVIPAARQFVQAAEAVGIPSGDYNGSGRFNPNGVVSLVQTNTRDGRRSSTYHGYLEGKAEERTNLTIITGAHVTKLLLDGDGHDLACRGIEYRDATGGLQQVHARRETVLSAGAVGSPHLLMLSGVGCRRELEAVGIPCRLDNPHVGKHLKDHYQVPMAFRAPGVGVPLAELGLSAGPDALRGPDGPLPEDPADDATLSPENQAIKDEAERRLAEWNEHGTGYAASSIYDGIGFFSTGLGDDYTHDAQIGFVPTCYGRDVIADRLLIDVDQFFENPDAVFAPEAENVIILASNCVPHGEGELVISSADPSVQPEINLNYFDDPHDLKIMVAIQRKVFEIAANWPGGLGGWMAPPKLAKMHDYRDGDVPSDAMLENMALHFAATVYHLSCTCRMGDVVDERLRVKGVKNLRIADASVMPEIPSGNINAPSIMIGERASDLIREDHTIAMETA
ncbi:GMC family oxidoreductase [Qipengyuania sp. RANM35]|uniref:GMC family oxidoreductase n=1 Tax=Qipengyuania sp. RANM35 TaxID=3068635 RepID=UPI0034DB51ED